MLGSFSLIIIGIFAAFIALILMFPTWYRKLFIIGAAISLLACESCVCIGGVHFSVVLVALKLEIFMAQFINVLFRIRNSAFRWLFHKSITFETQICNKQLKFLLDRIDL